MMRGQGEADAVELWPPASSRMTNAGSGDPGQIDLAAELLATAERPMLHGGGGALWAGAADDFRRLGEHLGASFTTTLGAGLIPEDHPQYIHILDRDTLEQARAEADVVLVVGARLGELDGWGRPPAWGEPGTQRLIQIDVDPEAIGLNHPVDLGILGDAGSVLRALHGAVQALTPARSPHSGFERYAQSTQAWRQELEEALEHGSGGINPGRMIPRRAPGFPPPGYRRTRRRQYQPLVCEL